MQSTTIIAFDQHAGAALLRARHRLGKFLLRHGRRFTATKKTWSLRHHAWLRAQTWPLPALTQTHEAYLRAVDEAVARLRAVETQLQDLVMLEPCVSERRWRRGWES